MTHAALFICRGAPATLQLGRFGDDLGLDDRGVQQSRRMSSELPACDWAWAGLDQASRQTAALLGLDAIVEPLLRDVDYGTWTGRTIRDVQSEDPDRFAAWLAHPMTVSPPGGEAFGRVRTRVAAWLDGQAARRGRSIVVAPAAIIRAVVVHLLDTGDAAFQRLDLRPLSRTEIMSDGQRWNLRAFGALEHGTGRM